MRRALLASPCSPPQQAMEPRGVAPAGRASPPPATMPASASSSSSSHHHHRARLRSSAPTAAAAYHRPRVGPPHPPPAPPAAPRQQPRRPATSASWSSSPFSRAAAAGNNSVAPRKILLDPAFTPRLPLLGVDVGSPTVSAEPDAPRLLGSGAGAGASHPRPPSTRRFLRLPASAPLLHLDLNTIRMPSMEDSPATTVQIPKCWCYGLLLDGSGHP